MLIVISQTGNVYADPESVELIEFPAESGHNYFAAFNTHCPDGKIISNEIPEEKKELAQRELKTAIHFGMFQPNIVVDIKDIMHHVGG